MAFKIVTLKEWKAMGLPTEIYSISFVQPKYKNKKKKTKKPAKRFSK